MNDDSKTLGEQPLTDDLFESDDAILARFSRRIAGACGHRATNRAPSEFLLDDREDFWERHLNDLVVDSLRLGVARSRGIEPFRDLLAEAFGTTGALVGGYVQLSGHVNNLALTKWMPSSPRTSPKIQALAHLHGRSLVLLEEIFVLTVQGYPSGASALARTLHEVRVTARFLHRFEARLSERYLASHIVELWRARGDFAPSGAARRSRGWLAAESDLKRKYDEVITKFGASMAFENGWAAPRFASADGKGTSRPSRIPFSRLEEEVRRPLDRIAYRTGSRQVHASHLGTITALRSNEPGVALLGPRPFDLDLAATRAMWDVQDVAESLLRSNGRLVNHMAIYYWLEALDQLSFIIRGSVQDGQAMVNSAW